MYICEWHSAPVIKLVDWNCERRKLKNLCLFVCESGRSCPDSRFSASIVFCWCTAAVHFTETHVSMMKCEGAWEEFHYIILRTHLLSVMVYNSLSVNPTSNIPQLELHVNIYSIRFKYSCQNLTLIFSLRTALHNSWLPVISHQFHFQINLFFSNNKNQKVYFSQSVKARAMLQ